MKPHTSSWIANRAAGRLAGNPDVLVGPDVVIDSRKAKPGALFIAFEGEKVDGHEYVNAAVKAGAAAVMVTKEVDTSVPQIVVEDPIAALSELAKELVGEAKRETGLSVIALTGSAGKTSTKDILAQLLAATAPTVAPLGSFNNELGAPLTASQITEETKYLVMEMGARGLGHVAWLCSITPPDISLVLNVGTAHLGEFGSRETIAAAKGEIVEALSQDGIALLNFNDPLVAQMGQRTKASVCWFGVSDDPLASLVEQFGVADLLVRAASVQLDELQRPSFVLETYQAGETFSVNVQLNLIGLHMVSNAVAAAAAAIAAGVSPSQVAVGLSQVRRVSPMRMELKELACGAVVIDDSYNANPDSMAAALSTLGQIGSVRKIADPKAKTVAVLADMLELGSQSEEFHYQVGRQAAQAGVDLLIAMGEYGENILAGAADCLAEINAKSGGERRQLVAKLVATHQQGADAITVNSGDVVLVKASRGMKLDLVADLLVERYGVQPQTGSGYENPGQVAKAERGSLL